MPTTVDAPPNLSPREFAAFRAGLLSYALRAVEDGLMTMPGAIRASFEGELAHRLAELEEGAP